VTATLTVAGPNKKELLQVIDHYKKQADNRKLKAAYFLIANMVDRYHQEGEPIIARRNVFAIIDNQAKSGNRRLNDLWDSLRLEKLTAGNKKTTLVYDAATIKAQVLIQHIDAAFIAWSLPWAKHLSFEDFCELILPYKLANEEPELWNSRIQASYKWLFNEQYAHATARNICLLLNSELKNLFLVRTANIPWDLNYTDLTMVRQGSCFHATQLGAYTMRAIGLPVVMDFTPFWANKSGGHEWNALLENGKAIPFVGAESDPGKTKIEYAYSRRRPKVYRHMYSLQPNSLFMQVHEEYDIPPLFRNSHMADVTDQYEPVAAVTLSLNDAVPDAQFAYLCVYNGQSWAPVTWAKIEAGRKVTFDKMGKNIVYLPMYYVDETLQAAGAPFILNNDGQMETCPANTGKKMTAAIYRKFSNGTAVKKGKTYELFYWNAEWKSLGKQQAAADSIVYKNIPDKALLIIKNPDQAGLERIFTYKNGQQVYW
jgi:hypothetical protein